MDARNIAQNPFARSPSANSTRDSRNTSIHPPPYLLQAPVRQSQSIFANDPFLPKQEGYEGPRRDPPRPVSQSPFSLEKYAASSNSSREPSGLAAMLTEASVRDSRGPWSLGDNIRNGPISHKEPASSMSLPPPPSAPTTSSETSLYTPTVSRDVARQRDHRPSSPRMYGDHPPPPPPPPFAGRPMLPPSPQYNPPASMSRVPPPPPPFSGGRDSSSISSANRPGSSMSISSMLDSAPEKPSREPGTATTLNGTSPTTSHSTMAQQQYFPASSPTSSVNGNSSFRQSSPEKHHGSQSSTNRPFRAYSGGATQRSYIPVKASTPEGSRFGPPSATSAPQYSPISDAGGPMDWKVHQGKNPTVERIIERPSSQPTGYSNSPFDLERKRPPMDGLLLDKRKQEENISREASLRQQPSSHGVFSFDFLGRQAQLDRQRDLENAEFERQKRLEQEQRLTSQSSPREARLSGMNYPFLTQSSVFSEPSVAVSRPEKESVIDRLLERSYQPHRNTQKGPLPEESLRQLREERQKQTQQNIKDTSAMSRLPYLGNADERQPQTYSFSNSTGPHSQDVRVTNGSGNQQLRPADDGGHGHRTMLALLNDNSKRAGRISPLPQAVQGAQSQKRGPSSDPSIKNEFSRMFAGIGSGVGSAGLNSGASTPFPPPSPKLNAEADQRIPVTNRTEPFEARARNGSRIGKRAKKVKPDDAKDVEIIEEGAFGGSKGVKRQKHSHHHHSNHRHHHHHRQDENNGTPSHRDSTTPISRNHLHHHHRADGTIHYHPSTSKPPPTLPKPPRIPTTTINNEATLALVRDLPRRHLGSTLYAPTLESPTSPTSENATLPYISAPYTIPRCEGKENCTLTVRIPRFYLTAEERQQICVRRAVWGTDIYSDDSDPLAAAIHAGWIRGAWGDGIDVSMLEINPAQTSPPKAPDPTNQTTFSNPPEHPILPPKNKDLHLTLLILPTLKRYASRTRHGIKSRAWGDDHDGLSFRVEKVAWVDEGAGRGEGRGGEARRRRLNAMCRDNGMGAPALRLGVGRGMGRVSAMGVGVKG